MSRSPHIREREVDEESAGREAGAPPATRVAPARSLVWASAVGNQAVQRLARRTVAREAVEEEELEQSASEPEPVDDTAPAAEEVSSEGVDDTVPAAEQASPEGFAPEEAAGLAALDDLPEDELPG